MNNYNAVLAISKNLQEEYGVRITLFESLQIAASIHQTEVLTAGLMVNSVDRPVALEAIAQVLGYDNGQFGGGSILNVLRNRE